MVVSFYSYLQASRHYLLYFALYWVLCKAVWACLSVFYFSTWLKQFTIRYIFSMPSNFQQTFTTCRVFDVALFCYFALLWYTENVKFVKCCSIYTIVLLNIMRIWVYLSTGVQQSIILKITLILELSRMKFYCCFVEIKLCYHGISKLN